MRIIDKIRDRKFFVSLEFFPPREKERWPRFFSTVKRLQAVDPAYVSVTYGALGSTREFTREITVRLKKELGLEPMAHLTCVGASSKSIRDFLQELRDQGVDNVLALRGDLPQEDEQPAGGEEFVYASDLVAFIRRVCPGMGIAVAGYPEGHPDSTDLNEDIRFLKFKCDQGADLIITQLFFDNSLYWDFVRRVRAAGVDKPVIPGILPVATLSGLKRILDKDCASIPEPFLARLEEAEAENGKEAVQALGIEYAVAQARELIAGGVPGIHFYTLNRAGACLEIFQALNLI